MSPGEATTAEVEAEAIGAWLLPACCGRGSISMQQHLEQRWQHLNAIRTRNKGQSRAQSTYSTPPQLIVYRLREQAKNTSRCCLVERNQQHIYQRGAGSLSVCGALGPSHCLQNVIETADESSTQLAAAHSQPMMSSNQLLPLMHGNGQTRE
jgi:hypothetical protein